MGVGRAGSSIICSLSEEGWQFEKCLSKEPSFAGEVLERFGGIRVERYEDLLDSDIVFITVPDREIPKFKISTSSILAHMSGFLPSSVLGDNSFSLHPFAPLSPFTHLKGFIFGIEGRRADVAKKIVRLLQGRYYHIPPEKKPLYHLASVILFNHLPSLIHLGYSILKDFGFKEKEIVNAVKNLVEKEKKEGIINSLTGPAVRRDYLVIEREIEEAKKMGFGKLIEELFKLNMEIAEGIKDDIPSDFCN